MKIFLLPTILISLFCSVGQAQNMGKWLNPQVLEHENRYPSNIYHVEPIELSEIDFTNLPKLDNLTINPYLLSKSSAHGDSYLLTARATMLDDDILLVDSNMDSVFTKSELIILPPIEKVDSIEYAPNILNLNNFSHEVDIEYKYFVNKQEYTIPVTLRFGVYGKYDSLTDSLFYHDGVSVGATKKFRFLYETEIGLINIVKIEGVSWYEPRFYMTVDSNKQKLAYQEVTPIPGTNFKFVIDSFDVVNKRILVRRTNESAYFKMVGERLRDTNEISTEDLDSDYKLIHFWGSWCKPCVRNIPKLKFLNEKYNDLEIMGVCLDNGKDLPIKLAKKHSMNWKHIYFEDLGELEKNTPTVIDGYPTYVLLDKHNIILGKFNKVAAFEEALLKSKAIDKK